MATIGIDLGTTFSCVATYIRGKIEIIPNGVGKNTTPSAVAIKEGDEVIVGEAAVSEGINEPRNTIFDIKRLIGKRFNDPKIQEYSKIWPFQISEEQNEEMGVVVDGKNYSAKFLSTQIIRHLKEQAENFLNSEVKKAVVTVPAYFTGTQKSITRDACKDAGLEVLQIITESTAAAISYYCQMRSREYKTIKGEKTCLIFDLGGGTLTIAVVTYQDKHIKILKIGGDPNFGGDPNLGGEDFDNAMVEYCIEEFMKKHQIDLRRPQGSVTTVEMEKVTRNLRRLKTECQKQKCFLSSRTRGVVRLEAIHQELDLVVPITRETFEELNESKFQRCLTLVKQNLEECGLRKEEIDDVVLVGGSTRIPRVQQLLTEYFAKNLTKNINAVEAVAFGAAMQAHFLVNADSEEAATFNPIIDNWHLDFPRSELSCAEEIKELRRDFAESNDKLRHELETLRKDLWMEREKSCEWSSSLTDLEGKVEMLLNRVGKEISIENIPSGLLSFEKSAFWAVDVNLKNSTSTRFLHPSEWNHSYDDDTHEDFPMPPEIPRFSQHGFGFTDIASKFRDCGNCTKEIKELRRDFAESNDKHRHELETLKKDLSMEREKFSILESKMEILLKEILLPSGLLSFEKTENRALAVILNNSTSMHFLHPNKWYFYKDTREYFPMPPEIPPFSQHGFGFTGGSFLDGLFSFQTDETTFVAEFGVWNAGSDLGLAFLPPKHPVDWNLFKEIRDEADWSKSREKCKVRVKQRKEWEKGKNRCASTIRERLRGGDDDNRRKISSEHRNQNRSKMKSLVQNFNQFEV